MAFTFTGSLGTMAWTSLTRLVVFPPGIQPNWVSRCGLGVVNSYIKGFFITKPTSKDMIENETG